jgi:TetR/AcrR family transcriptional regulator
MAAATVAAAVRRAPASRRALLDAAAAEFAARGYAGANVDRIARRAGVNKAMIYYHFRSKAALYREILHDMLDAVAGRVRAIAASAAPPDDKIRAYVEAIASEGEARPHFPPMWLREIAEGGGHVDAGALRYVRQVLASLAAIIEDGRRAGRFTPANPLLIHGSIIAPLMFFLATGAVRRKLGRAAAGAQAYSRDAVVAHIQRVTLAVLEGRIQ